MNEPREREQPGAWTAENNREGRRALCAKVSENRKNNNKFQVELIIGYREGASETGCLCRSSSLSLWPIVSDSLFCSGRIITYLNLVSRVRFDWLSLWRVHLLNDWELEENVTRTGDWIGWLDECTNRLRGGVLWSTTNWDVLECRIILLPTVCACGMLFCRASCSRCVKWGILLAG